jgi:hypothetical protein
MSYEVTPDVIKASVTSGQAELSTWFRKIINHSSRTYQKLQSHIRTLFCEIFHTGLNVPVDIG